MPMKRRGAGSGALAWAIVLCATGAAAQQPAASAGAPDTAALRRRFEEYASRMAEYGFSGAVLVASGGRVLTNRGYGMADLEKGIPNTAETLFNTGSLGKQFTAAAVLVLEERGALRTSDSIGRFFPGAPADKRGITLHQLLTHTSGLAGMGAVARAEMPAGRDEFVRGLLASPLRSPPGAEYAYSNAGYSLLAAVVEQVSGRPFEAFLEESLLRPAGLRDTGLHLTPRPGVTVPNLYAGGENNGPVTGRQPPWGIRGAGGVLTTTSELFRWYQALREGRVLSAESRRKLFTPYADEGPGRGSRYAYGWVVFDAPQGQMIAHNGGNTLGVGAELRHYPALGVVVVSFANVDGEQVLIDGMHPHFGRLVRGEPVALPPPTRAADPAELAGAAGSYRLPAGDTIRVTARDGVLHLLGEAQEALALVETGEARVPPGLAATNARAGELAAAAFRGDYGPLAGRVGARDPARVGRNFFGRLVEERGAFRGLRVLGTLPGDPPYTLVRVDFERGPVVVRMDFAGDEFMGLRPVAMQGREFLPAADGGFARYLWSSRSTLRARFTRDAAGSPTALVLEGNGGSVTAQRV